MASEVVYERVLLVKPTVYVYKIPPLTSVSRGFRAGDWNLSQPDWTGRLRLIVKGGDCFLRIEDSNSGELYCQAPVLTYPGPEIQQVADSRRYFVVRVVSDTGRSALIGIGFADSADSFDLNVALQDNFNVLKHQSDSVEDDEERPKLDLSLKTGIRVNLNIGGSKSSSSDKPGEISKPKKSTILTNPTKPFVLPPPPNSSRRRG